MELWFIIAVIVVLILLRIFFKLAKIAIVIGIAIVAAILIWNMLQGGGTP
jgi:hypothetical protein